MSVVEEERTGFDQIQTPNESYHLETSCNFIKCVSGTSMYEFVNSLTQSFFLPRLEFLASELVRLVCLAITE